METSKIFEETINIENRIDELKRKITELNTDHSKINELCTHEIVFKYNDNQPRRVMIDGSFFCPACCKTIKCYGNIKVHDTCFKNSRIIPLNNLSLFGTPEVHQIIRNEVYNNMNIYYNSNISIQDLSSKMEVLLKDNQNDFEYPEKVLKLIKQNKNTNN